ncbi:AAA family ATPase [Thermoflexibacter ruber]|uniref:Exonuclease SbcC n=1 Tax=Thermoflexibacter ruber TaxID=1003 RepID=A0A1I2H8W2_9BACT|nr:AAA family ATPase [Thermoflexibacter ruber]SFF25803.1 exonuclease SbcC [Thermoflexibacter ruber]
MKILALRFKNLNSLRKDKQGDFFEINFQASPLKEAGLFAITGATGAGKSTILDAITLALYGVAPRFGKDKANEILSRGAADCFSEVHFEVRNKIYTSKWLLLRKVKKSGEIEYAEKMELAEMGGTILEANKLKEVKEKVEQLTGLDYQRFLRSVMLAQGDFSAFLKADEKSRGELLEKITGTEIYSQLSKRADERRFEEKKKLELLESQIDESKLLSEEQKTAIKSQLVENQKEKEKLDQVIALTNEQIKKAKEIQELNKQLADFEQTYQQVMLQQENAKNDFEKLLRHEKAAHFKGELSEIETLSNLVQTEQEKLDKEQSQLPIKEIEIKKKQQEFNQIKENLAKAEQEQNAEFPKIEQAEKLDFQISEMNKNLDATRKQIGEQGKEINLAYQKKQHIMQVIESEKENLAKIQQYIFENHQDKLLVQDLGVIRQKLDYLFELKKEIDKNSQRKKENEDSTKKVHEEQKKQREILEKYQKEVAEIVQKTTQVHAEKETVLQGREIQEVEKAYNQLLSNLSKYKQIADISLEFEKLTEVIRLLREDIFKNSNDEKRVAVFLATLKEEKIHLQEKLDLARELYEKEQLIQSYKQVRQTLRKGEPCPLCGATHHPFAHYQADTKAKEQTWRAYQNELDRTNEKIKKAEVEAKGLEVTLNKQTQELADNQIKIQELQKQFTELSATLSSQIAIHESNQVRNQWEEKEKHLQTLEKQNMLLKEKQKEIEHLGKEEESWKSKIQKLEIELTKINTDLANYEKERQQLEQEGSQILDKGKKEKEALLDLLKKYKEAIPLEKDKATWLRKLEERVNSYQQNIDNEKIILDKINKLQGEEGQTTATVIEMEKQLKNLQREQEKMQNELKDLQSNRKAIFGEKNTQEEKIRITQTIKNEQHRLENLKTALTNVQQEVEILKSSIAQVKNRLQENRQTLAHKTDQLQKRILPDFENIELLKQSLLSNEAVVQIRKLKEELGNKLVQCETNIKMTKENLQKLSSSAGISYETLEVLIANLEKYKSELRILNENINEQSFRLRENENLEKQFSEKRKEIDKQRKEYQRWKTLVDIIGSKTTNELRAFAQSLTLAHLIALANKHLEKINPRYHLRKKDKAELDMEIVDKDQADNIRSINTLSGGETFLVSLALALGLSDLATAGRQTQIRSLFIDEGFGTLDPDTLADTINTLENLQLGGKQIGIISHVEELKNRITTQIQVQPKGNGVSEIRIVG